MKRQFSTSWNSSTQVRKQRKYLHHAPLHVRHKLVSAHLAKDLRVKYGIRSIPVRSGDEVIVQRGTFKKKRAKIVEVDLLKRRVTLENVTRQKRDGSKIPVFFNASKLMIVSLSTEDKKRLKPQDKGKQEGKHAPNKSAGKQ